MKSAGTEKCPVCSGLEEYIETADYSLPGSAEKLVPPNEDLEYYYRISADRKILKCPRCASFYLYCQWEPGGSDDAMSTSLYRSISPMKYIDVHRLLLIDLEYLNQRALMEPEFYSETRDRFRKGVEKELAFLRGKTSVIIKEALDILEKKNSLLVAEVYREREEAYEREIAAIAKEYLEIIPEQEQTLILRIRTALENIC